MLYGSFSNLKNMYYIIMFTIKPTFLKVYATENKICAIGFAL